MKIDTNWPWSAGSAQLGGSQVSPRRLATHAFGPNPGALGAKKFVPQDLPKHAPLVVVLHGCTQTPEGYDRGTGWTHLAAQHGFAVLYPEQQRANNMNGCFNWFEPGDMRRDQGEPASIKAMIDQMIVDHALDPARIFITGLSAGAAMAGTMLAIYPELFAGGGLIGGLPYGVARSMPAALAAMRNRGRETDAELGALVRGASTHEGRWPTISVWHGTADQTVTATNADAIVAQWCALHGLSDVAPVEDVIKGHLHRVWRNPALRLYVEEYVVKGMGHGTPIDTRHPETAEHAGPYLLDIGFSSTLHLAASWNLGDTEIASAAISRPETAKSPAAASPLPRPPITGPVSKNVKKVIEDALRAAGLM